MSECIGLLICSEMDVVYCCIVELECSLCWL